MRSITHNGLNLIKHFESFSPKVYICPAGYRTIGYGHVVQLNENFDGGVNQQQVEFFITS